MSTFDFVVIGGGHNGLTAAAYLLRAGFGVCVLEQAREVGGGCRTAEVTLPGFRHDLYGVVHSAIRSGPLIARDELGLISRYGLEYVVPDAQLATAFEDGSSLVVHRDVDRTCQSIAKLSPKDADAYPRFVDWGKQVAGLIAKHLFGPVPTFSEMVAQLSATEPGREVLSLLTASTLSVLDHWFEDDRLKATIAKYPINGLLGPDERGTGLLTVLRHTGNHLAGGGYPKGGSGALTEKLAQCVRDLGGTILVERNVERLEVADGRVAAAIVTGGERFAVRHGVVSSLHFQQLYFELLGREQLAPGLVRRLESVRPSSFSSVVVQLALDVKPQYRAAEDIGESLRIEFPDSCAELVRYASDLRQGRLPAKGHPFALCHTRGDPSRAPAGKHTVYLCDVGPRELVPGGLDEWDRVKPQVMERIIQDYRRFTTNIDESTILGRYCETPLDHARANPAFRRGDWAHVAPLADLSLGNEAFPGSTTYRGPLAGLYLCGASTFPGFGIAAASGRSAAAAALHDLGVGDIQATGR